MFEQNVNSQSLVGGAVEVRLSAIWLYAYPSYRNLVMKPWFLIVERRYHYASCARVQHPHQLPY